MQTSKSIRPRTRLLKRCIDCLALTQCEPAAGRARGRRRATGRPPVARTIGRGDALCRTGEVFDCLYVVRSGAFKCSCRSEGGRETVTAFLLAGDVVGLDAIAEGRHRLDVQALEDARVCAIPFDELESVGARDPCVLEHLHRLMARELVRAHSRRLMLTSLTALQRIANLLDDLRMRSGSMQPANDTVHLAMPRQDIASYLGLDICTVSRGLARLEQLGCVQVDHREVRTLDAASLRVLASGGRRSEAMRTSPRASALR